MKTLDEIAAELHERGRDAETHALTLIRCLDYDHALILDGAAYRARVQAILSAMDRVREIRLAEFRTHPQT